jgi:hypothetical protein
MSKATVIAKLVESGHEDLAEELVQVCTAANIMNADEFIAAVSAAFKKHLPHGQIKGWFSDRLLPAVTFHFLLQGDKSKYVMNIARNDPAYHIAQVYGFDKEGNIKGKLEADVLTGGSLHVKPAPDSYMAFDSVKIGWRKKTGTPEQVVKHFDNYFGKMKKVAKDNFERIPDRHTIKL